ncbi:hypothetical protein [Dermatobacter hominis]|uniref:hypothetical protein n=1 Tax=Dermatobacter hominis TaxID=2884263 RepID=UPI001D11216E|nr:hypothetical protein [Dermatobacter hominis]UDY34030.1 hypothetical protein LH044_11810 [Dermatobacter hominis]
MTRARPQAIGELVASLVNSPYLPGLAEHLQGSPVGRRRNHPPWVVLAYGAMARHFRSHNRLDGELRTGLWDQLRTAATDAGLDDPGPKPFLYPQLVYWRDLVMTNEDDRNDLLAAFTDLALTHARERGLLLPNGPGSLTHPHPTRTIYGDGTVVRPIYRRPRTTTITDPDTGDEHTAYLDPSTGLTRDTPKGRFDPSAADYHRHDGPIHGNNFVIVFARNQAPGTRVILGLDRVDAPGREADTAVALMERIHTAAGPGITAAVYDGAFHGVHIDRLMRNHGLVVINKVAAASRNGDDTTPKRRPLGTYSHERDDGTPCTHTLHIENGTVIDVALADDGSTVTVATATRRQIKRFRRANGTWRFSLGIDIACPHGPLKLWLSPHAPDTDPTLPEHLRLIPPADPDFDRLYGLRNDSESFNSQYKRTLLVDRATSVGWERQLFDLLTFAILENSRAWALPRHLRVVA